MDERCCGPPFWLYLVIILGLVLFAGMMSGLTLGLMSLGLVDLEVLIKSGTPSDQKHAAKILPVVKNQHLLLCTLLIGNSMAMEALPIFLDALVSPWGAILISVTLILMFGEIIPQAVCSRYGLAVGATMTPVVRILVFLFFPVTYPISKLLDCLLGKGHVALFRRAELKALVNMHGNEAGKGGELTHDETTIIAGALELAQKTAKDAMTSIASTFCIDVNAKLDTNTMNLIMTKGHSRIPVYSGSPTNIIGLILVKNLLTIRPEEELLVRQHATIRKIPRVEENMPLYDILNEFQKGHSHMAAVVRCKKESQSMSRSRELKKILDLRRGSLGHKYTDTHATQGNVALDIPEEESLFDSRKVKHNVAMHFKKKEGESQRGRRWERTGQCDILEIDEKPIQNFWQEEVIGVITMEDVIEELLQEEILDETDEYIDIHNKIKVNMLPPSEAGVPTPSQSTLPSPTIAYLSSFQQSTPHTSQGSLVEYPHVESTLSFHSEAADAPPVLFPSPTMSTNEASPIVLDSESEKINNPGVLFVSQKNDLMF